MPDTLSKFLIGFVGTTFAFLLLPKTIKLFVRRFVLSVAGEIITIVLTGLLTEKAIELLSRE